MSRDRTSRTSVTKSFGNYSGPLAEWQPGDPIVDLAGRLNVSLASQSPNARAMEDARLLAER
jgi:hypothetical protein